MTAFAPRVFGRTNEPVAPVWTENADGRIAAGAWTGLVIGPDDLQRRGGERVRERAAVIGRAFDFVVVRDVDAGDLKVGWPLHQLQRLRAAGLFRYVVVDCPDALEAEWTAANAPVHGVVVTYTPDDMAARHRAFDAARQAGVALIGHARTEQDAALQLGTPALTATLLAPSITVGNPMPTENAEALWTAYAATNAAPPKLRSGHPPDEA